MPVHDDLGTRMKEYYEKIPRTKLMRRTPVIIRLDGKSFHTFTHKFDRPFDEVFMETMKQTTKYLCENIQGCVLGYTQSDEISLILVDYQSHVTDAWFGYEVQKMTSVSASMATMAFNKFFDQNVLNYFTNHVHLVENETECYHEFNDPKYERLYEVYLEAIERGAMFDSRVFNLPKEEVTNYVYWRQLDASRNSVLMMGQAHFGHSALHKKTCNMIQDMLMLEKGINWNDLPVPKKRGTCVIYKNQNLLDDEKPHWIIDNEIPIFKGDGREYIDPLVYIGD